MRMIGQAVIYLHQRFCSAFAVRVAWALLVVTSILQVFFIALQSR